MNYLFYENENVLYADDLSITIIDSDLDQLASRLNIVLKRVVDWCKYNKMSLNPAKCEYVIFTNRTVINDPEILLGNELVKRASTFKYLGVHLDEKLNFNSHIYYVKSRLSQFCGVSYRLKNYFNFHSAKNVYYSCVYSIITYCITVWGGILENTGKGYELQRLHNRIVKYIFINHSTEFNVCLFKQYKILKMVDVYKFYVALKMFKIVHLDMYPTLQSDLNLNIQQHGHNTRNRDNYIVPFPRVNNIKFSYKYQYVTVWNDLPGPLKIINSLSSFKKQLSSHFLNKY